MSAVKLLLDTNICIYIIKRSPPQVAQTFQRYQRGEIGISSITVAELAYGVAKSGRESNREALQEFLLDLEILAFDEAAAWEYGPLRTYLQGKGQPIGPLDMQIAAHALSLNIPIVTNNVGEFTRVPGLKVENWFSEG